jgi:hypothetical protein
LVLQEFVLQVFWLFGVPPYAPARKAIGTLHISHVPRLCMGRAPPRLAFPDAAPRGSLPSRLGVTGASYRSRDAGASELCLRPRAKIDSPPAHNPRTVASGFRTRIMRAEGRRSAERRMPTIGRVSQTGVANLRTASAARLRAMRGAPAFRRFGRGSRQATVTSLAQLQAMLPGTWIEAGVTRPILSQPSDSTSRLGRSTEGLDARSRSGADCEPARKRRTRSTLQIASGMRPLLSEIRHRM